MEDKPKRAPKHLRAAARRWWMEVAHSWELEAHLLPYTARGAPSCGRPAAVLVGRQSDGPAVSQRPAPAATQSQRYGTGKIEQTNPVSESGGFSGGAVGCSTGVAGGPTGAVPGLPCASATAAAPISATASAYTSRIFLIGTSKQENERVDAATRANAIPLR